jgi:hypothetical protein
MVASGTARAAFFSLCIICSGLSIQAQSTITSIDARAQLNQLLAAKGQFRKQRWVEREVQECHEGCCGKQCAADCTRCRKVRQSFLETYTDVLRVTDVTAVVVGDLVVDTHFNLLPDQFHVHSLDVINCSPDQPQSLTKTLAVNVQTSTSFQMTRTVANTQSVSANVTYKYEDVGQAGLTLTGSQTVSLSSTAGQTFSKTVSQTEQVTLTAPPRKHSIAIMQVIEGGAQSAFRGKVRLDGPVDGNIDGISMASQLLSDAQRVFVVEGTLTVTDASQSQVIRTDSPVTSQFCKDQPAFAASDLETTLPQGSQSTIIDTTRFRPNQRSAVQLQRKARPLKIMGTGRRPRLALPFEGPVPEGTPGNICYIGPCNDPSDGTRPICYFDEDGACDECFDEPDPVCTLPEMQKLQHPPKK